MGGIANPMSKQNVLVVGASEEQFEDFAPMLLRKNFDVDRFPGAQGALELVTLVSFSAILVRFPVPDVELEDFLTIIRGSSSASRRASVALLASPDTVHTARTFLDNGVQLVLSGEEEAGEFEDQVSAFLGIKARTAMRIVVKLDVILEESGRERFMAQTKDISESGMFIAANKLYPVGSIALFEFSLPNDSTSFCGDAEIVRHSGAGDRLRGMGIRFLSFSQNTPQNLAVKLDQLDSALPRSTI